MCLTRFRGCEIQTAQIVACCWLPAYLQTHGGPSKEQASLLEMLAIAALSSLTCAGSRPSYIRRCFNAERMNGSRLSVCETTREFGMRHSQQSGRSPRQECLCRPCC